MAKRKTIRRNTDERANQMTHDKHSATEFKGLEEAVYCYELEILLNEYKSKYTAHAIDIQRGEMARFVGEFMQQDRDYIAREIQVQLERDGKYAALYTIKEYLKKISRVIAAKMAYDGIELFEGIEGFSAIPSP